MTPSTDDTAAVADDRGAARHSGGVEGNAGLATVLRMLGVATVALAFLFLFNNILNFWFDWPGVNTLFAHLELFGLGPLRSEFDGG